MVISPSLSIGMSLAMALLPRGIEPSLVISGLAPIPDAVSGHAIRVLPQSRSILSQQRGVGVFRGCQVTAGQRMSIIINMIRDYLCIPPPLPTPASVQVYQWQVGPGWGSGLAGPYTRVLLGIVLRWQCDFAIVAK